MKFLLAMLVCIILYLGMTAWWGYSSLDEPAPESNQSHQETKTSENEITTLGAALKVGFAHQGTFVHDFREEIVAVGTIILAFATAFLYYATNNLVKDAKSTSRKQLRAYLVAKVYWVGAEAGQPLVQVQCGNLGQTPALHLRIFGRLEVLPFPKTTALPLVAETDQPEVFIQPKDIADFPLRPPKEKPFTADEIQQAHSPTTRRLYIYGRLEYFDIFGDRHETPFGWTISGGEVMKNILAGREESRPVRCEFVPLDSSPT